MHGQSEINPHQQTNGDFFYKSISKTITKNMVSASFNINNSFNRYICSSQCCTTGITKALVFCVCDGAYRRTLAANWNEYPCSGSRGFLSRYLSGPLLYVRCHITINKMCLVHH